MLFMLICLRVGEAIDDTWFVVIFPTVSDSYGLICLTMLLYMLLLQTLGLKKYVTFNEFLLIGFLDQLIVE